MQQCWLTPYEFICKNRTSEPDRFILNPMQQMPGLNTSSCTKNPAIIAMAGIKLVLTVPTTMAGFAAGTGGINVGET